MKKIITSILILVLFIIIVLSFTNMDTTKAASTNLAYHIISLWQTEGSKTTCSAGYTGLVKTNNHEIRYVGPDPNNYIKFNDDLYQIVGVFDDNSHAVTSKNLVKIVRARVLTSSTWGVYNNQYKNDWNGSITSTPANANLLLNNYFYNESNTDQTYGACSNHTYLNTGLKSQDCSAIVGYGIKSNYSIYLASATWYLKGFDSNSYTRGDFYNCERGITTGDSTKDANCNTGYNGTAQATTSAIVGLLYASDYAYASGYYACGNNQAVNDNNLGSKNWLYQGSEWTITPVSSNDTSAFSIGKDTNIASATTNNSYAIRPALYLSHYVMYESGTGTFNDPFIISYANDNA